MGFLVQHQLFAACAEGLEAGLSGKVVSISVLKVRTEAFMIEK
jgi:hypothetical protein